jgi:hypothetical protein
MGCALLVAGASAALGRDARELTDDELRYEIDRNRALSSYVRRNGLPDLAESHFLADRPPWDDHEVTLYYVDERKEIGFTRASILGQPDIQIIRYERPLTDEQLAWLASHPRMAPKPAAPSKSAPPSRRLGAAERAEESAARAESAAMRVEVAADRAERAADRTEAVVAKMELAAAQTPRARRKK